MEHGLILDHCCFPGCHSQQHCTLLPESLTLQLALSLTLPDPGFSQSMETRKITTVPTPAKWDHLSVTTPKAPRELRCRFLRSPASASLPRHRQAVGRQRLLHRAGGQEEAQSCGEAPTCPRGNLCRRKQQGSEGLHIGNEALGSLRDW